ncbi:MAG: hypothetical protein GY847_22400 [Proteobacteria bacterium]|nr:hypothetical protein [Pseudomonadota bacterium]
MLSCLARAINNHSRRVELYRGETSAFDDKGRFIEAPLDASHIMVSIQPIKGSELKDLPENRRSEEWIKLYSTYPLCGLSVDNQKQPDRIKDNGKLYEIQTVTDWDDVAGYYKATAVRQGQ